MKKLLAVFLAFGLAGCAGSGPRYEEQVSGQSVIAPNEAVITMFRTSSAAVMTGIRAVHVKVGEEKVGTLRPGSYRRLQVTPGAHVLVAALQGDPGSCEVTVSVTGGQEYFFEVAPRMGAVLGALNPTSYLAGAALGSCRGSVTIRPLAAEEALPRVKSIRAME